MDEEFKEILESELRSQARIPISVENSIDVSRVPPPNYDLITEINPEIPIPDISDILISFKGSILAHGLENSGLVDNSIQKLIEIILSGEYDARIVDLTIFVLSVCTTSHNFKYEMLLFDDFFEGIFSILDITKNFFTAQYIISILINLVLLKSDIAKDLIRNINWEKISELPRKFFDENEDINQNIMRLICIICTFAHVNGEGIYLGIYRVFIEIFNTNRITPNIFIALRAFVASSRKILKQHRNDDEFSLDNLVIRTNQFLNTNNRKLAAYAMIFLTSIVSNPSIIHANFGFILSVCRDPSSSICHLGISFFKSLLTKYWEQKISLPQEILGNIANSDLIESVFNCIISGNFETKQDCIYILRHMLRIGMIQVTEQMINEDIFDNLLGMLAEVKSESAIYLIQVLSCFLDFIVANNMTHVNLAEIAENLDDIDDDKVRESQDFINLFGHVTSLIGDPGSS